MPAVVKQDTQKSGVELDSTPTYKVNATDVVINGTSYVRGLPAQVGVLKAMHMAVTAQGITDTGALVEILGALVNDIKFVEDKLPSIDAAAAGLLLTAKSKALASDLDSYNAKHKDDISKIDALLAQIDTLKAKASDQIDTLKEGASAIVGDDFSKLFDMAYLPGKGIRADAVKKSGASGQTRTRKVYNYLAEDSYTFGPTSFGTGEGCDWQHVLTLTPGDNAAVNGTGDWTCTCRVVSGTSAPIDSIYTANSTKSANHAAKSAVVMMRKANSDKVGPVKTVSLSVPQHFDIPLSDAEDNS